jgi:hypothetical protein
VYGSAGRARAGDPPAGQGGPEPSGRASARAAATALVAVAALGAFPGPAAAQDRLGFGLTFDIRTPAGPSGLQLQITYPPRPQSSKPRALQEVRIEAPVGTRFQPEAVAICRASDEELNAGGPGACPSQSRLGGGRLVAVTGIGPPFDPFPTDAHLFQGSGEIVEVFTYPGSERTLGVDRLTVNGTTLTAHPPTIPGGPPDGRTTVQEIVLRIPLPPPGSRGGRAYVLAPPVCPPEGSWSSRLVVTYTDGLVQTATSSTPCTASPVRPRRRPPAMRLEAFPRRLRAGRVALLGLRVFSSARCRRGATVSLGVRRVLTDRRGRAALPWRPRRPGVYRLRATKPGCATAVRRIVVAP